MPTNDQIKLVHVAARAAGLLDKGFEGRYRMLLSQYKKSDGKPAKSCKDLNNWQIEDFLAICEGMGFRMPGKAANYFRFKREIESNYASFAQQSAIKFLAKDMGWDDPQLKGMLKRMTGGFVTNLSALRPGQAYNIIEAFKAMLSREKGKDYSSLKEIKEEMEVTDDQEQTSQVG